MLFVLIVGIVIGFLLGMRFGEWRFARDLGTIETLGRRRAVRNLRRRSP